MEIVSYLADAFQSSTFDWSRLITRLIQLFNNVNLHPFDLSRHILQLADVLILDKVALLRQNTCLIASETRLFWAASDDLYAR